MGDFEECSDVSRARYRFGAVVQRVWKLFEHCIDQIVKPDIVRIVRYGDLVALPMDLHQLVGSTIANDLAVDHHCNLVTNLLCLIHSMCRQDNR